MSDTEGRPSKIRKLAASEDVSEVDSSAKFDTESVSLENNETKFPRDQAMDDLKNEEENAPESAPTDQSTEAPKLSKNLLKKLRRQEAWDAGLEDRRAKRRERNKAKQARKRAAYENADGGNVEGGEAAAVPINPAAFRKRPVRPIPVPVTLILDCDFETYMAEKELVSLGAQLTRCYSENRKNSYRTHLVISSWGGLLKTRFETVLSNNQLGWKGVIFREGNFVEAAKELDVVMKGKDGGKLVGPLAEAEEKAVSEAKDVAEAEAPVMNTPNLTDDITKQNYDSEATVDKTADVKVTAEEIPQVRPDKCSLNGAPGDSGPSIVYLTADSPHTLTRLSPNTSYIVGAIVDKNRHKGLCYKRACELGIPTAKLPIGEYMTMQSRSVLAVNHVVEIMLKWLETGDWGEAFMTVIPKRKEAKLKTAKGGSEESLDGNEEEYDDIDDGGASVDSRIEDD